MNTSLTGRVEDVQRKALNVVDWRFRSPTSSRHPIRRSAKLSVQKRSKATLFVLRTGVTTWPLRGVRRRQHRRRSPPPPLPHAS